MQIYTKEIKDSIDIGGFARELKGVEFYITYDWSEEEMEIIYNYNKLIGEDSNRTYICGEEYTLQTFKKAMRLRQKEENPYWMVEKGFLDNCINLGLITINNNDNNLQVFRR